MDSEDVRNSTPWSLEEIAEFRLIGAHDNFWRGRRVTVREHPTDPARVVTVGIALREDAISVACEEPREAWARRIDNGDWSDYR